MNTPSSFLIPISGLKVGTHTYTYELDAQFVNKYDDTGITDATLTSKVQIDISEGHIEIAVNVSGTIHVPCDRCLQHIDLPIDRHFDLIVKYSDESKEEDEVIYLSRDEPNLNLEDTMYDVVRLSLPMVNTYDCDQDEEPPCDMAVLSKLGEEVVEENSDQKESIWDTLKKQIDK